MDRSLIRTIRQLLSRSAQFEPQVRSNDDAIENLALLGGLEELARASLPQPVQPAEPVFVPVIPATVTAPPTTVAPTAPESQVTAPAPAPAAPRTYSSSRSVYRPALKDPALIEALMKFHQETRPAAPTREAPVSEPKDTGGFSAAPLPEIQAHPKPGGLKRPFGTQAVLRPHGPR